MKHYLTFLSTLVCALFIHLQVVAAEPDAEAAAPAYSELKPLPDHPLTADAILEKNIEGSGGREAYAKISSVRMESTMTMQGMNISAEMTMLSQEPNRAYVKVAIPNIMTSEQGFDGTTAWVSDLMGLREMTGPERATFVLTSDFTYLLEWKKHFESVELLGEMPIDDQPTYVVRLIPKEKEASAMVNFYDQTSFRLLRTDSVSDSPLGKIGTETYFSDYKKIDGIETPMTILQKMPQMSVTARIDVKKVEYNAKIDESIFKMPGQQEDNEPQEATEVPTEAQ